MDDILNQFWVDVVPIYPQIENSIVTISNTPNADKYEHALLYAILAVFLWLELPKKWRNYRYLIVLLYCSLLGGFVEVLQGLTSYRTANWLDCLANSIGTLIAIFIIYILSFFYERKVIPNCTDLFKRCKCLKCQKVT